MAGNIKCNICISSTVGCTVCLLAKGTATVFLRSRKQCRVISEIDKDVKRQTGQEKRGTFKGKDCSGAFDNFRF